MAKLVSSAVVWDGLAGTRRVGGCWSGGRVTDGWWAGRADLSQHDRLVLQHHPGQCFLSAPGVRTDHVEVMAGHGHRRSFVSLAMSPARGTRTHARPQGNYNWFVGGLKMLAASADMSGWFCWCHR